MREDMFKVIVERPRHGGRVNVKSARAYRNSEAAPAKLGIRKGYVWRKELNENLAPLLRWLESQVNRPWDKVYSDLCAGIDRRNTVQEHIFTHIRQFVAVDTRIVEGKVHAPPQWPPAMQPIENCPVTLYVHPVTRLLRANRNRIIRAQAFRQEWLQRAAAHAAIRRRDLGPLLQLHRIDGIWYQVTLAEMQRAYRVPGRDGMPATLVEPRHWDVLRKQFVTCPPVPGRHHDRESPYGRGDLYAIAKRQLSGVELRRHGIANDNAGSARRCRFRTACRPPLALRPARAEAAVSGTARIVPSP